MSKEEKIKFTAEMCQQKSFVFYPESANEASFIQKLLFAMRCAWAYSFERQVVYVRECVEKGITVTKGALYYGADANAEPCTIDQFEESFDENNPDHLDLHMTPEQKLLFRQMTAQMTEHLDRLEEKIDAVHAELTPKWIEKDTLNGASP